jgi:hypothetical protein
MNANFALAQDFPVRCRFQSMADRAMPISHAGNAAKFEPKAICRRLKVHELSLRNGGYW